MTRDLSLGLKVGNDATDFSLDLAVDVGQLTPRLQQIRVTIAIASAEIGDLRALLGPLFTQLLNDR